MLPDRNRLEFHVSRLSLTKYYSVKFGKNTEMRKTSTSDEQTVCCCFCSEF